MSRLSSFIASVIIAAAGVTVVFAGDEFGLSVLDAPLARLGVLIMIGSPLIWLATTLLAYGFTASAAKPAAKPMLMRAPTFGSDSRYGSSSISISAR